MITHLKSAVYPSSCTNIYRTYGVSLRVRGRRSPPPSLLGTLKYTGYSITVHMYLKKAGCLMLSSKTIPLTHGPHWSLIYIKLLTLVEISNYISDSESFINISLMVCFRETLTVWRHQCPSSSCQPRGTTFRVPCSHTHYLVEQNVFVSLPISDTLPSLPKRSSLWNESSFLP